MKRRATYNYLRKLEMLLTGWNVRPRLRVNEPRDPDKPEWFRPDEISLRVCRTGSQREHFPEEYIKELMDEGCFWEKFDIGKWEAWMIRNMLKYGWIEGDFVNGFKVTEAGLELHNTEGFGNTETGLGQYRRKDV